MQRCCNTQILFYSNSHSERFFLFSSEKKLDFLPMESKNFGVSSSVVLVVFVVYKCMFGVYHNFGIDHWINDKYA